MADSINTMTENEIEHLYQGMSSEDLQNMLCQEKSLSRRQIIRKELRARSKASSTTSENLPTLNKESTISARPVGGQDMILIKSGTVDKNDKANSRHPDSNKDGIETLTKQKELEQLKKELQDTMDMGRRRDLRSRIKILQSSLDLPISLVTMIQGSTTESHDTNKASISKGSLTTNSSTVPDNAHGYKAPAGRLPSDINTDTELPEPPTSLDQNTVEIPRTKDVKEPSMNSCSLGSSNASVSTHAIEQAVTKDSSYSPTEPTMYHISPNTRQPQSHAISRHQPESTIYNRESNITAIPTPGRPQSTTTTTPKYTSPNPLNSSTTTKPGIIPNQRSGDTQYTITPTSKYEGTTPVSAQSSTYNQHNTKSDLVPVPTPAFIQTNTSSNLIQGQTNHTITPTSKHETTKPDPSPNLTDIHYNTAPKSVPEHTQHKIAHTSKSDTTDPAAKPTLTDIHYNTAAKSVPEHTQRNIAHTSKSNTTDTVKSDEVPPKTSVSRVSSVREMFDKKTETGRLPPEPGIRRKVAVPSPSRKELEDVINEFLPQSTDSCVLGATSPLGRGTLAPPSQTQRKTSQTLPTLPCFTENRRRKSSIKDLLMTWIKMTTESYQNISISNYSASWADGLAFCALMHHFYPDAFDYSLLKSSDRAHNFKLAFDTAKERAGIEPLLDISDLIETESPDWKCIYTYVQTIYKTLKNHPRNILRRVDQSNE